MLDVRILRFCVTPRIRYRVISVGKGGRENIKTIVKVMVGLGAAIILRSVTLLANAILNTLYNIQMMVGVVHSCDHPHSNTH